MYIVTTSALDYKQLYTFYKFYLIKQTFLSERIRYLIETLNCSSQAQLHSPISACIVFHGVVLMPYFNTNLQQGCSFKRVPLTKETIYYLIKSLMFKKNK